MSEIYLIIVILLFLLAIFDLIVGVSNDAVNFLNSAFGSRVASRKLILIIASLGILIGTLFSNGMMDVARKDIFIPEYFYFADIMIIFIAVMFTDIILLDFFNTFGIPTSTTVSIVFELLGAAVAVSALSLYFDGDTLRDIGVYIHSSNGLIVIGGIFCSIFIAFIVGSISQFISRFLFTFQIQKNMTWLGGLWSGLALSAITYFLMISGFKGTLFGTESNVIIIQENMWQILGFLMFISVFIMQICIIYTRLNVFKIVVLFGAFALAISFAGNDLVNFIGIPIAGLESYLAWQNSDLPASDYAVHILQEPVRASTIYLVIAGLIMVATIWFSKKARSVIKTEVNLGRQWAGQERFSPNLVSQRIVKFFSLLNAKVKSLMPKKVNSEIEKRFDLQVFDHSKDLNEKAAFDLLRASVNLTMACVIIGFATSMNLPFSTTIVTFMVAMGASLADKSWSGKSAGYRVAGVLIIMAGWLITPIAAFMGAAFFATIIFYFEIWAILFLVLLLVILLSKNFLYHKLKARL